MDRIDAMRVFVTALDEGSLAGAARRLNRSPAAVSRAIVLLEDRVGVPLLHRTTRSIALSEAGRSYADTCRRILSELDAADRAISGERLSPRGLLSVTAPIVSGSDILRPIVDAFLDAHPDVQAKLLLLDRPVNLIDEGIDVGLRIARLSDSSLVATKVGEVRRVVVASPEYLAKRKPPRSPEDLAGQTVIALTDFGSETWSFASGRGRKAQQKVRLVPRLAVNTVPAALGSALAGHGVTRLLSYQAADAVRDGRLVVLLAEYEPPPVPVHIITPEGRLSLPKVRAFVDFAVPRLRTCFARL
jgi:DNA-binding transcriptional LysR family regulator